MNTAFLVTFLVYLIFLMSIGIYFYFKTNNLEQYLLVGVNQMRIAIGLIIAAFLNWHFIAPKLRVATEETHTITLPMFFQKKLHNSNGMIKNFSAVIIGMFTIVFYIFLGGYLASVWTDFFQGIIMFFAIIMVPVFAYNVVGGWQNLSQVLVEKIFPEVCLMELHC